MQINWLWLFNTCLPFSKVRHYDNFSLISKLGQYVSHSQSAWKINMLGFQIWLQFNKKIDKMEKLQKQRFPIFLNQFIYLVGGTCPLQDAEAKFLHYIFCSKFLRLWKMFKYIAFFRTFSWTFLIFPFPTYSCLGLYSN